MPVDRPTTKQPQDDRDEETDADTATVIAAGHAVVFHDDPQTPADFVLHVLMSYLQLDILQAQAVVQALARDGRAVAQKLPKKVAEQRAEQIMAAARPKYPLNVTVEATEPEA